MDLKGEIQKIFDIFNQEETILKISLHSYIENINKILEDDFKGIEYERQTFKFGNMTQDERLISLNEKINNIKSNPNLCFMEGLRYCQNKIRNFLSYYNIGYCSDFSYSNNTFKVEIGCNISNRSIMHDKNISKKIIFQQQLKVLKDYGFDLDIIKEISAKLKVTSNNIELLKKLLESIGARYVRVKYVDNKDEFYIDKIQFYISMENLKQLDYKPFVFDFEITENLNDDEKSFLITEFKELYSAYQSYYEIDQAKEPCFYIIKNCLSHICKTLNIQCSFCKDYIEKMNKNLEIANTIKEKEDELGTLITKEILSNGFKTIEHNLNQLCCSNFGYKSLDLNCYEHYIISDFHLANKYLLDEDIEIISDDDLKLKLDCNNGTIEDEDIKILATDKNLEYLKNFFLTRFNCKIKNFDIDYDMDTNKLFIRKFTIVFYNIQDLL